MEDIFEVEPFGVNGYLNDGKLNLNVSKNLSKFSIFDSRQVKIGIIYGCLLRSWSGLGVHVSGDKVLVGIEVTSIACLEDVIGKLHGSFLLETLPPLSHRLYSDVGGTIPLVYCPELGKISSSAGMMFCTEEYSKRFLQTRYNKLIESDIKGAWIPGFITAHEGVFRLLPNFYLDLGSWTTHRYWPRREHLEKDISLDEAAESVSDSLRGYINAVGREFNSVSLTLTAGFDTRILLAGSRDIADKAHYFTTTPEKPELDQIVASDIAKKLLLKHRLIPIAQANSKEIERWDILVGHATREVSRDFHPTLWQIKSDVMLTGMYGEVGRSRLYEKELNDIDNYKPDASFVAGRIGAPMHDAEVIDTLNDWLNTISWAPTSKLLDIAFNELRFGGWAMSQAPIQRAIQFSLMPFAQQDVQLAFMNCRPSIKTTSALFHKIGLELWPEAMQFDINKYGDYRDSLSYLKKFVKREHIVRTLRYLLARWRAKST